MSARAFAERVPVVALTGSPATINFRTRPLLHHTLGDYQTPLRMYEKITVASTQLVSAVPAMAGTIGPAAPERMAREEVKDHESSAV